MLNLLVAVMNATIQKVNDQKQLYWKFVRTSIWIEYFDDSNAIPVPFSIINIPVSLFHAIVQLIKLCKKRYKIKDIYKVRRNDSANYLCNFNEGQMNRRRAHAKLMLELLDRFTWDLQNEKDILRKDNFRKQSMKMKIFKRNSEK